MCDVCRRDLCISSQPYDCIWKPFVWKLFSDVNTGAFWIMMNYITRRDIARSSLLFFESADIIGVHGRFLASKTLWENNIMPRLWQVCSRGRSPKRISASCVGWTLRQLHFVKFPLAASDRVSSYLNTHVHILYICDYGSTTVVEYIELQWIRITCYYLYIN